MDRGKRYTSSTYRQSIKKKLQRMRKVKFGRKEHVAEKMPPSPTQPSHLNLPVSSPIEIHHVHKDVPIPSTSFALSESPSISHASTSFASTSEIIMEQAEKNVTIVKKKNRSGMIAPVLQEIVEGRRVVNIAHLFKQILNDEVHKPFSCSLVNMVLIQERRNGLKSDFILKCKMCDIIQTITSEECSDNSLLDINSSAVLSAISTGIGYSNLEEIHTAMAVPSISSRMYTQHHDLLANTIHKLAWIEMEAAGKEEKKMAEEDGEMDENGIPLVSVIADGAWCKRSYGTNYSANSGVGCIIGVRSQKLLYIGIRNKYCAVCELYTSKKVDIPQHMCFKNWRGTSTSMEADIIVEGFRRSVDMHGIIYNKLIGDGDSSVSKKLLEAKPYGNRIVKKVECRNHLLRNFCKKLVTLTKNTKSGYSNSSVPPLLRQRLKNSIMRLRMSVVKAIEYRRLENVDDSAKTTNLKKDITNSPYHIFGSHTECAQYFCSGEKQSETNIVSAMKECGLFQDIMSCVYRLVHNAESLILNMTNNCAEQYNSVVCKFLGGKRINFSRKRGYETRCEAAAISYNAQGQFHNIIHKSLTGRSPTAITKTFVEKRNRKKTLKAKRKLIPERRRKKTKPLACEDDDYGPLAAEIANPENSDMTPELYTSQKQSFLEKLKRTESEISDIEFRTRGQSANNLWKQERSMRLTASNFGKICKMRPTTSCVNSVKVLLYSSFISSRSTDYGITHEPIAKLSFAKHVGVKVNECGFFIGRDELYYLGASPDGLIGNDTIIEIKCPYSARDYTIADAIKNKIITYVTIEAGQLKLKESHNYMYQIQGQLAITQRTFCYFILWTKKDMMFQKIKKDELFWQERMLPNLQKFYFNCLLPEMVDPRYTREPPNNIIRNPPRT